MQLLLAESKENGRRLGSQLAFVMRENGRMKGIVESMEEQGVKMEREVLDLVARVEQQNGQLRQAGLALEREGVIASEEMGRLR
jgi:succinyl-CoA synthetase alpha subunit